MEDKTIKERMEADQRTVERSFTDIASLLVGEKVTTSSELKRRSARNSAEEICKYFHLDDTSVSRESDEDGTVHLERILRPAGYISRTVKLEKGWWRRSRSVMLAKSSDGQAVIALIPRKFDGYTFFDYRAGHRRPVNAQTAMEISDHAQVFIKPLPQRELDHKDVGRYLLGNLSLSDLWIFVILSILVTLLSFFTPLAYRYLIGRLAPTGQKVMVVSAFFCLGGVLLGKAFFSMSKIVAGFRLGNALELDFQNAVMGRLMYLPSSYFSKFATGEVSAQINALGKVPRLVANLLTGSGLEMVMMLSLLVQANKFGGPIVYVTVLFLLAEVLIAVSAERRLLRAERMVQKRSSVLYTLVYNMYEGMQKLKNGGAEKRAFARWASLYRNAQDPTYVQPISLIVSNVLIRTLSYLGTLAVCLMAVHRSLSQADYIAYTVSIGIISSAFFSVVDVVQTFARIQSNLEVGDPILSSVPELTSEKQFVRDLQGKIEVNHVGFKYPGQNTHVLSGCSFTINAGDYVALVGRTGSGKSTLVKLLLGFLKMDDGAIYYDGKDLNTLDLPSLRCHIGTVMQNGKLFAGDIRSNISIMDSAITDEEIRKACEIAGIWDDIQKMPMGLHTFVGEGAGGLSGGQKQRIMIARALVSHPKMMILDEAMNSLDYLTQKRISMYLENEKCTRIIVSHRLSTIKQCSKILVLDKGRIVEEGTYDELAVPGTQFSRLVNGTAPSHGL